LVRREGCLGLRVAENHEKAKQNAQQHSPLFDSEEALPDSRVMNHPPTRSAPPHESNKMFDWDNPGSLSDGW